MNASRFARMKRGAILINTARSELIDDAAFLEALHAGQVQVGIDCFVHEPPKADEPILSAPNVVLTPHIGGTTSAAFRAMGVGAAGHILGVLEGPQLQPV